MRNGQRWCVLAVDPERDRVAARRLDDGARTVFDGDYLHRHVTHGYAVTVHSAQGVTADTTHAVLGENTSRNLLYVALTRGREHNHAYLYERQAGETDHEHADQQPGVHVARRGTNRQAAHLVRGIIANRDTKPTPLTMWPRRHRTESSYPSVSAGSWNAAPTWCTRARSPTGTGMTNDNT